MSCQALKGTLGIPLIRFEDAIINMYPYTRVHPYETQEIIINDILKHFREVSSVSKRGKITGPPAHPRAQQLVCLKHCGCLSGTHSVWC